jgi:hypothetical protein
MGMLDDHLALSTRHLAQATVLLARQRELVERLDRGGRDTETPRALLVTFEEIFREMQAHDGALRAALAEERNMKRTSAS